MLDIDWNSVLVTGAAICSGLMVGAVLAVGVCVTIGRALANRQVGAVVPLVVPESAEEVLAFSGRPNYAAVRESVLRADKAARLV